MENRGIFLFKLCSVMTATVPVSRECSISAVIQVETTPDTDWMWGWMDNRAPVYTFWKREKSLILLGKRNTIRIFSSPHRNHYIERDVRVSPYFCVAAFETARIFVLPSNAVRLERLIQNTSEYYKTVRSSTARSFVSMLTRSQDCFLSSKPPLCPH